MSECEKPGGPARSWPPPSPTGGVKAMSLQGRLGRERERLHGSGMTEKEREWRALLKQDQILCAQEPVNVPEIYQKLNNPIKRFYRYPLNCLENSLANRMCRSRAHFCRALVASALLFTYGVYATAYYFKYNTNDWTRKGGWRVTANRRTVVPGEADWPYVPDRHEGADYCDRGFKLSPLHKHYPDESSSEPLPHESIDFPLE